MTGNIGKRKKEYDLKLYIVAILATLLVLNGPVAAQDFVVPIAVEVPNLVGVAVGVVPDYEGSDDDTFGALPAVNLQFENRYIRLLGSGLTLNILNHEHFRFGPLAYYRFGRDDDIDDEVVKRVHEVDDSVELGAFVGFHYFDQANPRIRYGATLEFQQDVSDGHEGYIVQLSARGWYPITRTIDIGLVGGTTYASDDYMSAFFGVTPTDSASSGLNTFKAESGIKDVYIQPMLTMHLGESWHTGAGVRFKSLLSDASDSPVVKDRGSDTQIIAAVSVVYSW